MFCAYDTLSAINAANAYLPTGLPYPPLIRKVNPADTPILVLGVSSDSLPLTVVDALTAPSICRLNSNCSVI